MKSTEKTEVVDRRAVRIARLIEEDISVGHWPLGAVYGSQFELRERYLAGGESLHEAIRILEFNGVVRMRRGPGGGLMVDRPPLGLAIASIAGYLQITNARVASNITFEEIAAARAALAAVAAQLACERAAKDDRFVFRLQRLLFHLGQGDPLIALAEALDDPCLRLAACCLHSFARAMAANGRADTSVEDRAAALSLAVSISAKDRLNAAHHARALIVTHPVDWLAEPSAVPDPFLSYDSPLNRSRVGQLVRMIATDLNRGVFGNYLGSEAVLSHRYAAARATIRQALCVLEDAGIVEARPGRKNGWFVCAPNTKLPLRQMRNYLAGQGVAPAHARVVAKRWRRAIEANTSNIALSLLLQGLEDYGGAPVTAK